MNKGFLLTFEGGEGAGKTTLIQSLKTYFEERSFEVLVTREPGGTELGENIRALLLKSPFPIVPKAELCLFLASRAQHIVEVILPALKEGQLVLCDRFNDSSCAYQGYARGLGLEYVQSICTSLCSEVQPDLTFYLDLHPKKGRERREKQKDRIESEDDEFHRKIREGYVLLKEKEPDRIHILDASLSVENVYKQALKIVNALQYFSHTLPSEK